MLVALRRNVWWILLAAVAGIGVGAYLATKQAPVYRATAVFQFTDVQRALTGGLGAVTSGTLRGGDPLISQIQVLLSQAVLGDVVDETGLRLRPVADAPPAGRVLRVVRIDPDTPVGDTLQLTFGAFDVTARTRQGTTRGPYGSVLHVAGIEFVVPSRPRPEAARWVIRDRRSVASDLSRSLTARPRPQTDIVDISYSASSADEAARVLNAVVVAFSAHNARARQQSNERRRIFLEGQLAQLDTVILNEQFALNDFREREQLFRERARVSLRQEQYLDVEQRRAQLYAEREVYRTLLAQLQLSDDLQDYEQVEILAMTSGAASSPVFSGMLGQLRGLQSQREALTAGPFGLSATNPDVMQIDALVAATRRRFSSAVMSYLETMVVQIEVLDALQAQSAQGLETLPALEVEEAGYTRRLDALGAQAERMREQLQSVLIAAAVEEGQVEILDLAGIPGSPINPWRMRLLAVGLALGLMVGSGGALLRESLNTSIRRREDVEVKLRVIGLAAIPNITPPRERKRLHSSGVRRIGQEAARAERGTVTFHHSGSPAAEAFRALRTNLMFSRSAGRLKTLVVTSASPSEGKTTTATNLAIAFAQQGLRTLLVDCDVRYPQLNKVFDVEREPGLTEWVADPSRADCLRETMVDGLWLLPAGTLPKNPVEFLGSPAMLRTLRTFADTFDITILDTCPVLAAADPLVLGAAVHGVLVVVRAGQTDQGAAKHAVDQLDAVGARVVGVVLNDPESELPRYGRYHYAYGDYGRAKVGKPREA